MDHERQVGRPDASLASRHTLTDNTQYTAIPLGVISETLRHLRNQHRFCHCCLFVYAKFGLARNSELLELAFYDMNFNPKKEPGKIA